MIFRNIIRKLIIILLLPKISFAGSLESDMQNFWNSMGGSSNITSNGAYQGQSAGMYTLGNIHARTGIEVVHPLSVELPSARAGCGGIDLFAGSFSHINSDQLVATMKAIANNSAGFVFQLALETISPAISEKMEEINAILQQVNEFNINSCEQSAALVGGLWPKYDRASSSICASIGNRNGIFSDYAATRHGCDNDGRRSEVNNTANSEHDNVKVEDINLAWDTIKKSGIFGSNNNFDRNMAELFMTLTGTIIIKAPSDSDSRPNIKHISAKIDDTKFITSMLDGGEISVHRCDEIDKCLNVRENSSNQNIRADEAYKVKVRQMIESMIEKVSTSSDIPLSDDEMALLNMTSIPVYKMLNVYSAYSGASSMIDLPSYSEIIALDLIYEYIYRILDKVEDASNVIVAYEPEMLKLYKGSLISVRQKIVAKETKNMEKANGAIQLVERTSMVENLLSGAMGKDFNFK